MGLAASGGLGVTIHVGEEGGELGVEEIAEVIESLQPDRIGHGILAARDPALMAALRDAGVTLEICPTSNLLTKALADEEAVRDTFRAFVDHGVPFTIATDGPEMMRTHLRDEFELLLRIGALDEDELGVANERGHEASFVERAAHWSTRHPRVKTTVRKGEIHPSVNGGRQARLRTLPACRHSSIHVVITARQRQVIELIAQGLSNEEVGARARHLAADGEGPLRRAATETRRPATSTDSGRVPAPHG